MPVSLVIGVLTHVLWDSSTHGDGFVVQHVALLREPAFAGMDGARVLQHVSTVLGGSALPVRGGRRWARWRASGGRLQIRRWALAVLAAPALVALLAGVLAAGSSRLDDATLEAAVSAGIKAAGTAAALGVLLYAVLWHVLARTGSRRAAAVG